MHAKVKLHALTSLRFFAAAMIVIGHAHPFFGSAGLATNFSLAQGVSFFFVLSGFILTYNYPVLTRPVEVFSFLKARFARIWPSHVAAIGLLFVLTGGINIGGLSDSAALFSGIANLILVQSVIPLRDVFLSFNGVAWSISTEMFFYLAFPLLITSILPGWKSKLTILSLIAMFFLWFAVAWEVPADESLPQLNLMGLLYVNPLVRLLEFFSGVLSCHIFMAYRCGIDQSQTTRWFTLAEVAIVCLSVLCMWLSPRVTTFLGWQGSSANVINYYLTKSGSFWIFAPLIIIFAIGKGFVSRFLSWPFMVLLGEISFALYLVHTIVLKWYELHISLFGQWHYVARLAGYWLLSLFLAWLLHKIIENPCRKMILAIPQIRLRKSITQFMAGYQSIYISAAIFILLAMRAGPAFMVPQSCAPGSDCDIVLKQGRLCNPANFGDYVSLVALRSITDRYGDHFLDLVFEVARPLPEGYRLAVHMVAADGSIVTNADFDLVRSHSLQPGDYWMEHVKISSQSLTPTVVALGLAIYSNPASPLSIVYPVTDYNGRRMLIDLATVGLLKRPAL